MRFLVIFALNLCRNCKHYTKGTCSLFPILDIRHERNYLDCTRVRSNAYFCGEKGRYYEPLELPENYDFEKYIQFLS